MRMRLLLILTILTFSLKSYSQKDSVSYRYQIGFGFDNIKTSDFNIEINKLNYPNGTFRPFSLTSNIFSIKYKRFIGTLPLSYTSYNKKKYSDTSVITYGWNGGINVGYGIIDNKRILLFPYIGFSIYTNNYKLIINDSLQTTSQYLNTPSMNKHLNLTRTYLDIGIQLDLKYKKKHHRYLFIKTGILLMPGKTTINIGDVDEEVKNNLNLNLRNNFYIKLGLGAKTTNQ